jgi:predicted restriction endonuclease
VASASRDWQFARAKVDYERGCRVCGSRSNVEAAHTIGRKHDGAVVDADDIVPLCREHHQLYDRHELDLLPYLTHAEQAAAVAHVGIESARRRLTSTRN